MRSTTFTLTLSAATALCGGCSSTHQTVPDVVPVSLHAPADQLMTLKAHATGAQVYECRASDDSSRYVWVLKAPDATLVDEAGRKVAKHYGGPTWEASDGSTVVGEVVAREASPDPKSIPWLLLKATAKTGHGQFSSVRSIQRLHTVGGVAPSACTVKQVGRELRVKYSADYYFYVGSGS
jgi:hypothetical protein